MSVRTVALMVLSTSLVACSASLTKQNGRVDLSDQAATVAAVTDAENRWQTAFQQADLKALDELLAPEYVLAGGRKDRTVTTDRATWLKNAQTEPESLRKITGRVIRVAVAGDNFAVAEVEQRWLGKLYFISDTWVRRNGVWRVVYRHSSAGAESTPR